MFWMTDTLRAFYRVAPEMPDKSGILADAIATIEKDTRYA